MKVTEPATMLTDYALALSAILFGYSLWTTARPVPLTLWAVGFFVIAAAAACGGTFHGFAAYQSAAARKALWDATIALIGLGCGFMISGTLAARIGWSAPATPWLAAGLGVSLVGVGVMARKWAPHRNFNHNDVYHCIQIAGLYLFYRGAAMLAG